MIRLLLNLVSFLAIVNLLALAIFAGWLWRTDRLSAERILRVREMFAVTIADEWRLQEENATEDQQQFEQQMMEMRRLDPPLGSEDQLVQASLVSQREQHAEQRLRHEKQLLLMQLDQARNEIADNREAFERERQTWVDATEQDRQRRTDEQFAQTVRLYESIAPKQAKQLLVNLVQEGGMQQAVAYLNAMNSRAASRIISELKSDAESRLATELLERLRTFGLADQGSQGAADDDASRSADFHGEPADD